MPRRRRELRPSTANRYSWMIENYVMPAIGAVVVSALRAEHLDRLYTDLIDHGSAAGGPLSTKTVYDVHVVIRSALGHAVQSRLVEHNVALQARPPRPTTRSRPSPEVWTAEQLAQFLEHTAHLRLHCRAASRCHHGHAARRDRRTSLGRLEWSDAPALDRAQPSEHQWSIDRDPDENIVQPAMHRSRRDHGVGPRRLASTSTSRPPSIRLSRSGVHQHVRRSNPPRVAYTAVRSTGRPARPPSHPLPRPPPHPCLIARRDRHSDQGRVRAPRSRSPRLHDGHVSTLTARNGRQRSARFRSHALHCSVDVYRFGLTTAQVTASLLDRSVDTVGRRPSPPGNAEGPERARRGIDREVHVAGARV